MYLTLMHTIQGTQLQYLYTFAWGTGMRRGEISALRWCDFDEVNGTITIEHAAKRTKNVVNILENLNHTQVKENLNFPLPLLEIFNFGKKF